MMWSRITAVLLVLAAALWIGSGLFGHHADEAASAKPGGAAEPPPASRLPCCRCARKCM